MSLAKRVLSICLSLQAVLCTTPNENNPLKKMEELIPDTIDRIPEMGLEILYPSNKKVEFGNELTPTQVKDAPSVKWQGEPTDKTVVSGEKETFYTLAMVDPDAPSREDPKFREVNHWLVVNIKGGDLASGDVVTEYLGSGPPKGTGLHRYIFLLFKQKKKQEFDHPKTSKTSRKHRLNFSIRKFAATWELGQPIAGNFYRAQWDEYVDERNKNISND